ncbi:hypothetical protein HGRIS_011057 [Hohenbuehelia grisea]
MVYLKRLTIIIDEDSEKGFGLINANLSLFQSYDIISLLPTTAASFSLACLTHSLPSPLTAHIISLPLTLPRLPFHMKHTLIRTALKNGAVFEITYAGALGGDPDLTTADAGAAEGGAGAKRNWWAAARELCRVTKGKGLVVGSGAVNEADLRGPRDVANVISLLGLSQDQAQDTLFKTPKSLVVRAATRKTHKAVLSEPRVVIPVQEAATTNTVSTSQESTSLPNASSSIPLSSETPAAAPAPAPAAAAPSSSQKRPREANPVEGASSQSNEDSKKKKRKKNNLPP